MDHLREIYMDHAKTAVAVLLYLVTFGLHQASLKVDDQLALMHYHGVNGTWSNVSTVAIDLIGRRKDRRERFPYFFRIQRRRLFWRS